MKTIVSNNKLNLWRTDLDDIFWENSPLKGLWISYSIEYFQRYTQRIYYVVIIPLQQSKLVEDSYVHLLNYVCGYVCGAGSNRKPWKIQVVINDMVSGYNRHIIITTWIFQGSLFEPAPFPVLMNVLPLTTESAKSLLIVVFSRKLQDGVFPKEENCLVEG